MQARRKQFWIVGGGGGGGGKDLKGAHNFFSVGAHQWRSQLFGMGGGQGYQTYRQKIKYLFRTSDARKYLLS